MKKRRKKLLALLVCATLGLGNISTGMWVNAQENVQETEECEYESLEEQSESDVKDDIDNVENNTEETSIETESIAEEDIAEESAGKDNIAVQDESATEDEISYSYDETTKVLTVSGKGAIRDFEYKQSLGIAMTPWRVEAREAVKIVVEDGITSIGKYAFYKCESVQEIVIGNDVTFIEDHAFEWCNNLKKVTMGKNVKHIKDAFIGPSPYADFQAVYISDLEAWCKIQFDGVYSTPFNINGNANLYLNGEKITEVIVPESITDIKDWTFCGVTNLEKVVLHKEINSIGAHAFAGTALIDIHIPSSVKSIDEGAFSGCEKLTYFAIPDSITEIKNDTFYGCTGMMGIGIPNSVTTIESSAFSGCTGITEINIPDSVTAISDNVFWGCSSLSKIKFSENLTKIGAGTFAYCTSLENITIPDSVTTMGANIFRECNNLKKVTIGKNVKTIGGGAFENAGKLSQVILPEGVETIGVYAFRNCVGLTEIHVPDSVKEIGDSAFYGCTCLSNLAFGGELQTIGDSVFSGCTNLSNITFKSVQTIGEKAFNGCTGLSELRFPKTLTAIKNQAFEACQNLKKVTFEGSAPAIASNAFHTITATCWYTPDETWTKKILSEDYGGNLIWTYEGEEIGNDFYKCGENITWELQEDGALVLTGTGDMYDYSVKDSNYAPWYENRTSIKSIKISDGITHIGEAAFYGCSKTTSVVFPETLESIGSRAFYQLGTRELTLPEKVTKLGTAVFEDSQLRIVVLPDQLDILPDKTFCGSNHLRKVTFPSKLKTIGDYVFASCYELESVVLPEGLETLGEGAFSSCGDYARFGEYYSARSFNSVKLPSTLKSIGDVAFLWCGSLESIDIPDGVTNIGDRTFAYCYHLSEVSISANMKTIAKDAFLQCKGLKNVTFRWGAPSIHANAWDIKATCYYPSNNPAWTADMLQNYGGKITWIAKEMEKPSEGTGGGSGGEPGKDEGTDSGSSGGESGSDNESESGSQGGESGSTGGNESGNGGSESGGNSGSGSDSGSGSGGSGSGTGGSGSGSGSGGTGSYTFQITLQPSDQEVSQGEEEVFSVKAVGNGLTYQWQYSNNAGKTWGNSALEGNAADTQKVTGYRYRDGQFYRCIIKDEHGNEIVSNTAKLTVLSAVEITEQPQDQSVSAGEKAVFEVKASGDGLTYQWQYSKDGKSWNNSALDGYDTAKQAVEAYTYRNGQMYRCVITDSKGNQMITEKAVLAIGETEKIQIITQPVDTTVSVGKDAVFTVQAQGSGLKYQWQYSSNGIKWYNSGLEGYNTAEQTVKGYAYRNNQLYRCVITDADGNQVITEKAKLIIGTTESIVIEAQPSDQNVIAGEDAVFEVQATGEGLTYQWQYSSNGTKWYNSTLSGFDTNKQTVRGYAYRNRQKYRCVITDKNGNQVTTDAAELTVK